MVRAPMTAAAAVVESLVPALLRSRAGGGVPSNNANNHGLKEKDVLLCLDDDNDEDRNCRSSRDKSVCKQVLAQTSLGAVAWMGVSEKRAAASCVPIWIDGCAHFFIARQQLPEAETTLGLNEALEVSSLLDEERSTSQKQKLRGGSTRRWSRSSFLRFVLLSQSRCS